MKSALSVRNVVIKYDSIAVVDDVSFEIAAGKIVMIIGPNGSGKTTLLRALAGLVPFQGEIEYFGADLKNATGQIGYVPQRFDFDRTMPLTVREFLALSSPRCFTGQCVHQSMYQEIGVKDLFAKSVAKLSGGQFQRVLIARALLENPKILLLDEPASGIDMEGQQKIHQFLKKIQATNGTTIVMISHEIDLVTRLADEVLCLNRRLICQGTPQTILSSDNLNKLYGDQIMLYHHHHD
jgi:zinc transport system ATP-binding protein